ESLDLSCTDPFVDLVRLCDGAPAEESVPTKICYVMNVAVGVDISSHLQTIGSTQLSPLVIYSPSSAGRLHPLRPERRSAYKCARGSVVACDLHVRLPVNIDDTEIISKPRGLQTGGRRPAAQDTNIHLVVVGFPQCDSPVVFMMLMPAQNKSDA